MITKQAIERLKNFKAREKRRALPDDFNVYVEHQYNIDALDMAIEALSKQCASSEQADTKLFNRGYWLMPGEVFISHNVLNEVLNTIIKSINTEQRKIDSTLVKAAENDEAIRTDDHIADSDKMVDQFRGITKKTDDDTISRAAAIDAVSDACFELRGVFGRCEDAIKALPPVQPEPLSDAYMNAVWTWLIDYQIKAAELKGRYTPYEVLSWVVNDWRKEHERSDKQTGGD